jgi:hypothetical protein
LVVHGVKKYVQTLSDRALWHDRAFTFFYDVVEDDIQMVELTQEMFCRTRLGPTACTSIFWDQWMHQNQVWPPS